jgi:hypothetical protein
MGQMQLGAYIFALNPSDCTVPKPERSAAAINTLGGVAFMSWGSFQAGQRVYLKWEYCSVAQFDAFQGLIEDDASIVWDPDVDDGTNTLYDVEILSLNGDYFLDQSQAAVHRRNVSLQLVILGEAS